MQSRHYFAQVIIHLYIFLGSADGIRQNFRSFGATIIMKVIDGRAIMKTVVAMTAGQLLRL